MDDNELVGKKKPEELIRAEDLIDDAKVNEAHDLLNNFERKEGLTLHDKVLCHLLKCNLLYQQGRHRDLVLFAEQTYNESLGLGKNFLSVDALKWMAFALIKLTRLDKAYDLIKQGEELLKTLPQEVPADYKQREAYLAFVKGYFYEKKGDADRALEHAEHSLALREELGIKHEISESLNSVAWGLSLVKGELDRGLKYAERGLALAKESTKKYYIALSLRSLSWFRELDRCIILSEQSLAIYKELNNKRMMAIVLNNVGDSYRWKGKLDRALECLEQSLALFQELGKLSDIAVPYDFLIQILIDMGDLERAQQYLHDFEQINDQLKDKQVNIVYLFDKALVLKTSHRARNRVKAEEIFNQILEDKDIHFELTIGALLNLCELLLAELQMTNEVEILEEIKPFITQLLNLSDKSHSFWILGETYLLQAKLALISLNLEEARRLLTKAQEIAEKYGLTRLAMRISSEHDQLLNQLDLWENLRDSKAPLEERIELARLNDQMGQMLRKRVVEPPKLDAEQPVLISIMSKEGEVLLSSPFTADMTIDESHFGEFLSSCNTFCDQIFSESFDRVKFGRYTILITAIEPFCVYYMFQGRSYSAQHKLDHFCENLKKDSSLMETLKNVVNVNEVIEINKHPSLENLIVESFLSDPQKFKMPFKAYEGDDPFVFVSYAHTDKLQVYPIIDYLNKKGTHIWYDEGIPISENWKRSIVKNLERCKAFLLFITPHILESDYVRKEISFAAKRQKKFFGVYLKETELPSELEFDIADIQAMKKYLMPETEFYNKLREMLFPVLQGRIISKIKL